MSDGRMETIERDIREIKRAVSEIGASLARLEGSEDSFHENVCKRHVSQLTEHDNRLKVVERKVENKWPSLIFAFLGSMAPPLVILAFFQKQIVTIYRLAEMSSG